MKKNILISFLSLALLGFGSCESPDEMKKIDTNSNSGIMQLTATFMDGTGEFSIDTTVNKYPFSEGEVVKIVVPWFYPLESNNETSIDKMKIKATLPNNVYASPGFDIIDLTKETPFTITSPSGKKITIKITGERKKSSEAMIKEFQLPAVGLNGFIMEANKFVGLVSGGMDLSNQKPKIKLSFHATIDPDTIVAQNFNNPVTYTVTAHDGTKQVYTIRPFSPKKVAYGLRVASARQLWFKGLSEMGLPAADHMTTAIAVSGNYLMINTRNQNNVYVDRFSGEPKGNMQLGTIKGSLTNFFATSDEAGNILICNLAPNAGANFVVYKFTSVTDASPVKLIDWPTGGLAIGRKMSVRGNLNTDALITVTQMNSKIVHIWEIKGGALQSATPKSSVTVAFDGNWTNLADAVAESSTYPSKLFISGYPSSFGAVNPDGSVIALYNLVGAGYNSNFIAQSLDYASFNGAKYLAQTIVALYGGANNCHLYDVTIPANLASAPKDPKLLVFSSPANLVTNNTNSTGDVAIKVSDDGFKMVMYMVITNFGVAAYEFDCIDVDNIFGL